MQPGCNTLSTPLAAIAGSSLHKDVSAALKVFHFVPQSSPVEGCRIFSGYSGFEQAYGRFLNAETVTFCDISRLRFVCSLFAFEPASLPALRLQAGTGFPVRH